MFLGMNYINGWWTAFRSGFPSINPRTEDSLGEFPNTTDQEVLDAVAAAKKAQKTWRELSRVQRGEYFDRLCQLIKRDTPFLVKAISEETGKHENESLAEVNEALHMAQFTFGKSRMPNGDVIPSEIADKDSYVIRKPKGVIAVISPWNFPYAIGGFWCAAPALLEGNTVIWKPSENTPMVAQMAVAQYIEAGFPNGVINLLHGSGHVGSELVYNKDIKHYCFTGSYKTGQFIRQICAVQGNKTCSLEMGSKSAVIVCADADMDMAVKACVASAYKLSGQRCVSAGRILVEQQVFMEFARRFVEESQKVELGPLINAEQKKKVSEYNALTYQDEYTQVLLSAKTTDSGNFISPHIYTTKWNVPESRKFLIEEVFGPHVALIPFDDLDEAIAIYNDTNFGLSLGVITEDFRKAKKVQQECEFGLGYWNGGTIAAESHLPFGGIKNSGYGGSSAAGTFESVVNKVTWTVNYQKEIVFPQGMK